MDRRGGSDRSGIASLRRTSAVDTYAPGSGVGVWAVAGEAARTADVTRTKMQRENISVLLHKRLRRGQAARHPVFDARIEDSSAENCQESLCTRASKSS